MTFLVLLPHRHLGLVLTQHMCITITVKPRSPSSYHIVLITFTFTSHIQLLGMQLELLRHQRFYSWPDMPADKHEWYKYSEVTSANVYSFMYVWLYIHTYVHMHVSTCMYMYLHNYKPCE